MYAAVIEGVCNFESEAKCSTSIHISKKIK